MSATKDQKQLPKMPHTSLHKSPLLSVPFSSPPLFQEEEDKGGGGVRLHITLHKSL